MVINGHLTQDVGATIDCGGADLDCQYSSIIAANVTGVRTLDLTGGQMVTSIATSLTISANLVRLASQNEPSHFSLASPLGAVEFQGPDTGILDHNLICSSLLVDISSAFAGGLFAASYGVTVSGAIVNRGTMNLLTSIVGATITNTGTISNSTIALNGGTIINTGGTISGCTITGGGTIIGGTVTGCAFGTGPVKLFGVTDGGGNSGTYLTFPPTTALEAQVCRQNEEGNA
jgi:hypothetical protein